MKILIIEDEIPAVKRLVLLLQQLEPSCTILDTIDEVAAAVEWFNNNPEPDLIFMDIQLADGYSFEIFEQVKITAPTIFVTAFDQYAVNAFRVNGLDYILKPIQKELLQESLSRFKSLQQNSNIDLNALSSIFNKRTQYKERFLIKSGEELNFVKTTEIAYFLSESSYSFIVTKSGSRYILDQTMDQIEASLDPLSFFRINRKQIIGLDSISKIAAYFNNRLTLTLTPEEKNDTIVSRSRVKPFKEWLNS